MTGSNFREAIKIRGNLVATKSRIARWHSGQDTTCDACGRRETLGHILQVCPRSWGERIHRHDKVSELLKKMVLKRSFNVSVEPVIKTDLGVRKPDLVISKDDSAWVVDTIICSDNADLKQQYAEKVTKYNVADVARYVLVNTGASSVKFGALVVNWRGAVARPTRDLLREELGLTKRDLQLLIVRVLEGNARVLKQWRRSGFMKWSPNEYDDP